MILLVFAVSMILTALVACGSKEAYPETAEECVKMYIEAVLHYDVEKMSTLNAAVTYDEVLYVMLEWSDYTLSPDYIKNGCERVEEARKEIVKDRAIECEYVFVGDTYQGKEAYYIVRDFNEATADYLDSNIEDKFLVEFEKLECVCEVIAFIGNEEEDLYVAKIDGTWKILDTRCMIGVLDNVVESSIFWQYYDD